MTRYEKLSNRQRHDFRQLRKAHERDEQRLFLAEGLHLNEELTRYSVRPKYVIIESSADDDARRIAMKWHLDDVDVFECSPTDMQLITNAVSPQSIVSIVPYLPEHSLGTHVVVLDAVNDPGNVGSIIRIAAWFGFTDVVLCSETADLYNPKTMRSTAGAAFAINVVRKSDIASTLVSMKGKSIVAGVVEGGNDPSLYRNKQEITFVIGSEARGVSQEALLHCSELVTIPGGAGVESLNAAAATAILCYEARMMK